MSTIDILYYLIKVAFDYTKVPYVPYIMSRQFRRLAAENQDHSESHIAFDCFMENPDVHQAICGYYGISGFGSDKSVFQRLESYSKALIAEDKVYHSLLYLVNM